VQADRLKHITADERFVRSLQREYRETDIRTKKYSDLESTKSVCTPKAIYTPHTIDSNSFCSLHKRKIKVTGEMASGLLVQVYCRSSETSVKRLHGVTSQKTLPIIVTDVGPSDLSNNRIPIWHNTKLKTIHGELDIIATYVSDFMKQAYQILINYRDYIAQVRISVWMEN
jgi:hypothetical protein